MGTSESASWIVEAFKMVGTGAVGGAAALWLPFIRRFFWGPKLSLSFSNDELEGCVVRTPISYGARETVGYYIRVKVKNTKPTLAKDCRAFLVKIEKKR